MLNLKQMVFKKNDKAEICQMNFNGVIFFIRISPYKTSLKEIHFYENWEQRLPCKSKASETNFSQRFPAAGKFSLHQLLQHQGIRKPAKDCLLLFVLIYRLLQTWNRAETKHENVKYDKK